MGKRRPYLAETYCRKCGKVFFPYPDHVYKERSDWYCSWTCFNHRNDTKLPPARKEVEMLDAHGDLIRVFPSIKAAAEHVLGDEQNIGDACRYAKKNPNKFMIRYGYAWRYLEDHPDEPDDE